jgi:asparagine synthase (glutamine-hydrolysing)
MCGLAGIIDFTQPSAAHSARVARMRALLRHRGPDGEGEHTGEHVSLAHTRLAILDVEGGAQPMASPDGRWVIVYNGELANADALRGMLDWSFRTRSDTEVVLAAYARWGASCAVRLSGMFAFFVWDTVLKRGFGARDRLGVKPLVFAREHGAFVFASEAHAIVRTARTSPHANVAGVLEVLVAPCFSGVAHSMFDGVVPLPPAHLLFVDREGSRIEPYWDWPCDAKRTRTIHDDPDTVVAALREEVPAAIRRALVADVGIGLFSSGGLDSTYIAGVMAEHARARGLLPVSAFTVTFDDQAAFDYTRSAITGSDDTPFARDVAAAFGLDPQLVHVSRDEIARDLRAVAMANDALPAWEQEIAQHRLARAAARSLKAVVVGDAADETHYGYHFLLDEAALRGPGVVLERLGSVPIRADIAQHPVRDAAHQLESLVEAAGGSFHHDHDARVQAMTYLIVKRWLPRLLHNGDIHTMRASLEARVPFADAKLVDLASGVAPTVALRHGVEKWALREAARSAVPERVRVRRKSALPKDLGVEVVFRAEAVKVLRDPPALLDALVDTSAVRAIATRPTPLTEAERAILFRVVTLAHWSRYHEVSAP